MNEKKIDDSKPVAWIMLNSDNREITISQSDLIKQSDDVKKIWEKATPLFLTSYPP